MPDRIFDLIIQHQINTQRLASHYASEVIDIIDGSESELIKFLDKKLDRFGAVRPDLKTNMKFKDIEKGVVGIRGEAMLKSNQYMTNELTVMAESICKDYDRR